MLNNILLTLTHSVLKVEYINSLVLLIHFTSEKYRKLIFLKSSITAELLLLLVFHYLLQFFGSNLKINQFRNE